MAFLIKNKKFLKTSKGFIPALPDNERENRLLLLVDSSLSSFSITAKDLGNITEIAPAAFAYRMGMQSIEIPDTVTNIGESAFAGCIGLSSINIPKNVTSIGESAFSDCERLKSVYITDMAKWCEIDFANGGANPLRNGADLYLNDELVDMTNLIIPSDTTSIGRYAFYGCSKLTSITIPDSITRIGSNAFSYCENLTEVHITDLKKWCEIEFENSSANPLNTGAKLYLNGELVTDVVIPDTITNLSCAFSGCTTLNSIIIPDTVQSISKGAFYNCSNLKTITVPFIGSDRNNIDSAIFGHIFGAQNYYSNSNYVPSSLKEVTITGGTSVGNNAFYGCYNLTSITIPDTVTSIGQSAFYNCNKLTSITIPESVTSISNSAFSGCSDLNIVHITDIAKWCGISFGNDYANPLYYAHNLYLDGEKPSGDIIIPNGAISIPAYTFYGCSALTSITIPSSVTSVGSFAFEGCSGLTSITIPFVGATKDGTSNTYFGYIFGASSYSNNGDHVPSSLKEVIIAGGTSIGGYAFYNCSGVTNIIIPDSVTSIGDYAFSGCSGLSTITVPESVMSIGNGVFSNCSSLTNITISDGVTSIGDQAFYSCTGLQTIFIPSTVTTIDTSNSASESPFYSCPSELQVYTDATEKLEGWGKYWNCYYDDYSSDATLNVIYGISREQYNCGISETGHEFEDSAVVEPTCTESGEQASKVCTKCGYRIPAPLIQPLGHEYGEDNLCIRCGQERPPYVITNDVTYPWSLNNNILTSTNHSDSSTSNYIITAGGDLTISFDYSVSSESNYDWLTILKGTSELVKKSGSVSYTTYSVTLTEGETLTFRYSKDGSASRDNDCAYIRNLTIT